MKVIHIDGYAAGKQQGFEGSELYLVACCGMCTFAAVEPISNASAKTFASAIMKIMLRYGLSHTVVLDKDSKFLGVCRESLDLLHINCHILSGGNHNPMLVERVNRYLNNKPIGASPWWHFFGGGKGAFPQKRVLRSAGGATDF